MCNLQGGDRIQASTDDFQLDRYFALGPVGRRGDAYKLPLFDCFRVLGHVKNIRGMFSVVGHYLYPALRLLYKITGDSEFLPSAELLGKVSDLVCGGNRGERVHRRAVDLSNKSRKLHLIFLLEEKF